MIFFYLLVSIMPLMNHPLWSHFVGALTMTKFVGIASLIYAIGYCILRRRLPNFLGSWLARLFVLFFVMSAISYFTKGQGDDPWYLSSLMTYISLVMLLCVAIAVIDSEQRLRNTILVIIGSLAIASLYVIREWQLYHNLFRGFRPGYVTGDPNYFTLSAVVCLPLAWYMLQQAESWWGKAYCLGCALVTLVGVMLAASRGGFLGLVAAALFIVWRSPQRVRNFIVIAACMIPLILLAPDSPVRRLLHPNYADDSATDSRLELWRAGWKMIEEYPLTGIGLDNFKPMVTKYEGPNEDLEKIAHNTYIEIAAENGIPTLIVFLGILYTAFVSFERVRKRSGTPRFLVAMATAMEAGLVGCVLSIMFISCEQQKLLWFLMFLAPCVENLARAPEPAEVEEEDLELLEPATEEVYDQPEQPKMELTRWN